MPQALPPFESARLKIARAAKHIAEYQVEAGQFLLTMTTKIVVEQPPTWKSLESIVWTVREFQEPPPSLSAIMGDIVHNLRTALDLLASDLVALNGRSTKGVYFPFASEAAGLKDQIKAKCFHRAPPSAIALLKSLRPYAGGNDFLRALHDFDLRDKHQALLVAVGAASLPPVQVTMGTHINSVPSLSTLLSADGQWVMILPHAPNMPIGYQIPWTASLVFGEGCPLAGHEILTELQGMLSLTTDVVEKFAALFPGAAWAPRPPQGGTAGMIAPYPNL